MPKFIPYNYDQTSMVVINFKDQLQPGTFEHAVHYLINEKLDLSIFYLTKRTPIVKIYPLLKSNIDSSFILNSV